MLCQVHWENSIREEATHRREQAAQRKATKTSQVEISLEEGPTAARPRQGQDAGEEEGGVSDGKGLTSKQARVQAAMRDPKLSPQVCVFSLPSSVFFFPGHHASCIQVVARRNASLPAVWACAYVR